MTETNLILPFITKATTEKADLSFPAELASVVCLAEAQRKKPGFLRDRSEKIAFVSKVYYPYWVVPHETACLLIDGLNPAPYTFTFNEPAKIAVFLEELNKNATNPQALLDLLQAQAKDHAQTSPVTLSFPALQDDKDLLALFLNYYRMQVQSGIQASALIPPAVDETAATEVRGALSRALRVMQADAKGLQYAITMLKAQLVFQKKAADSEVEVFRLQSEQQVLAVKPVVEKTLKKLTQKHEKVMASFQRAGERKIAKLDRARERYLKKLAAAEKKKEATQKKIDSAKKRGSKASAGSFALKKYQRDIESAKKEIKAVSEETERLKKELDKAQKQQQEDFQTAVRQEEAKITTIMETFNAKIAAKQKQVQDLTSAATTVIMRFEGLMDDLKRSGASLKGQVEVAYTADGPEAPFLVQVPLYLVKFSKDEEARYSLISPVTLGEAGMLDELKNLLKRSPDPKIKTLMHPLYRTLEEKLTDSVLGKAECDPDFRLQLNQLCRSSNIIDQDTFAVTLNEGLDEIQKKGYITEEEASSLCKQVIEG
jgi:predicted  nucleic acid-binding Zn-ribbon protein